MLSLSSVCEDIFQGVTIKPGDSEDPVVLKVKNIRGDEGIDFSDVERARDVPERKLLRCGDLISPFIGEAIRQINFAIFKENEGRYAVDGNTGVIRPNPARVSAQYLQNWFQSSFGRPQILRLIGGGGVPFLGAYNVAKLVVATPPLRVQRELVTTMDAARAERRAKLAEADALLAGLDGFLLATLGLTPPPKDDRKVFAIRRTDAERQGHLNADYFHPERILALRAMERDAQRLRCQPLAEVVSFIREQIKTPGSNYLSLAHVQSHTGELVAADEEAAGACSTFEKDDVLFARLRPYLNKVYRAESAGCCSPEFHVLRAKNSTVLRPDYLAAILRSSLLLAQTRHMMTGNTHPRLTNEDVVNLVIPIPAPAVQERIAAEARRRREEARRLRAEAEAGWQAAKRWFEEQLLGKAYGAPGKLDRWFRG